MRLLSLLFFSLLLGGCASTKVSVDYDTETNFSNYQLYALEKSTKPDVKPNKEDDNTDKADNTVLPVNPLILDRVNSAISRELPKSGLTLAPSADAADILVRKTITSQQRTEAPRSRGSIGFGSSGRRSGVGLSFGFPLSKPSLKTYVSIFVDLIDAKDQKLKWRGSRVLEFAGETPQQMSEEIDQAVAEIFSQYPPK